MAHTSNHHRHRKSEPITVIIPAYNEALRIGHVIEAALQTPIVTHLVVVDDGSRDGTADVVSGWQRKDARVRLIRRKKNRGKAAAIALGGQQAAGDIVVLLDADLKGLTPQHIEALVNPVRRRECVMTSGLFREGRRSTDITHRILPFLSGQRCLRWSLFKDTLSLPSAGWSLETALNLHAWYQQYATRRVVWKGVTHAMRPEKQPGLRGYTSHITMWSQILRYTAQFMRRKGAGAIMTRLQQPTPAVVSLKYSVPRNKRSAVMRRPFL